MESVKYWKNDHACVDQKCSPTAIPIVGLFSGDEDYSFIKWISERQETALDYDHYHQIEPDNVWLSDQEKRNVIIENRDQKAYSRIGSVYPGIPVQTIEEGEKRLKQTNENGKTFDGNIFLPSTTPGQFNFTAVFLTNNGFQGVLHSFLRHNPQWGQILPAVGEALNRMKSVRDSINSISGAYQMSAARSAISEFLRKLEQMEVKEFNEIQSALNDVQVAIVKQLLDKLTYANYRGEGVNEKGQLQTFFQMKENLIAMIGYSREIFLAETNLDSRPIRTIITIYFIDDAECRSRVIMKSY